MGERGNRQREQKTASEEMAYKCCDGLRKVAAESPRMSSVAVIHQQRTVGMKDIIPKKQELWVESMRSEPVILGQSIQVHGTINTGADLSSIKADLLKKVPHKQCGQVNLLPYEAGEEGEKVSLDAEFEDEMVWSDMQKNQQAQLNEICSDFKAVFSSKLGNTDVIPHHIDMGGHLPIEVMSYTMKQIVASDMPQMLHHGVTRKRASKGRDAIVISPEKKVSDHG
uniref:Uncharacterized protein n=1 Tax=Sphaerodactylus townsendi TaxID=933632 RepID=A0ACB8G2T9_9SAUR